MNKRLKSLTTTEWQRMTHLYSRRSLAALTRNDSIHEAHEHEFDRVALLSAV